MMLNAPLNEKQSFQYTKKVYALNVFGKAATEYKQNSSGIQGEVLCLGFFLLFSALEFDRGEVLSCKQVI